jgi:hypothetical protein
VPIRDDAGMCNCAARLPYPSFAKFQHSATIDLSKWGGCGKRKDKEKSTGYRTGLADNGKDRWTKAEIKSGYNMAGTDCGQRAALLGRVPYRKSAPFADAAKSAAPGSLTRSRVEIVAWQ